VVYGKEMMLKDLGGYKADKVCANMFHAAAYCEGRCTDPNADLGVR
jgi:hypothetical protein